MPPAETSNGPSADDKKKEKADPKKKDAKKEEEMSEEDIQKKGELDLLVERVQDVEEGVQKLALETMISEIKTSTGSMTSVPKALKFLRPHYPKLKEFFEKMMESENKARLADVLSCLGMTMASPGTRESLKFKLQGSKDPVGTWGHEYVRNLAGEVGQEYAERAAASKPVDDLLPLIDEIVPFDIKHNAQPEACDLLMEVEMLPKLLEYADEANYERICLYLTSCASYAAEPEDSEILRTAYDIYSKLKKYAEALRVALKLNDKDLIAQTIKSCEDPIMRKQLAFMLARQQHFAPQADESLSEVINNTQLTANYAVLARDLEVVEPKTPEDIYKTHLTETRQSLATNVDSARQNLASTFVNAFVNAGFGNDKLMISDGNKWVYKNKEHGMMSAAASLGMVLLWDVDGGLSHIDKFLYSNDDYIKAGALLAVGIVNSGVRNECDPALALLSEYVENERNSSSIKVGAILGLGLAYAGSARDEVLELLTPVIADPKTGIESAAMAALAIGLVFVGSCHNDAAETMMQSLMEREEAHLDDPMARFIPVGLALLFLGKGEAADATLEVVKTLKGNIASYAAITIETLAYAGTGNVLKVQKLLGLCGEHLEGASTHQAAAVIGIALVAMGEELGLDMAMRCLEHLLQYGEQVVRRGVPLAMALLNLSNPRVQVMDTLSKLSHDSDAEVAQGAILGLGLTGAGTNNARAAGLLRQLAAYYHKDPNHLFMVRIAQGLLHMGKGLIGLNPYHSHRFLMHPVAAAGLAAFFHACLDLKNTVLGSRHYLLYLLATAMYPRMLLTLNSDLKPLRVPVRVGQAVDTVGQAGRPKTITGFQTHTTPVLIGYGERAELATDEYLALSPVLEGFVILKPNPDFVK